MKYPQTNLDSILKSRNITLPTRVHIVKAMVFLMSIRPLHHQPEELMLSNCGAGEDS